MVISDHRIFELHGICEQPSPFSSEFSIALCLFLEPPPPVITSFLRVWYLVYSNECTHDQRTRTYTPTHTHTWEADKMIYMHLFVLFLQTVTWFRNDRDSFLFLYQKQCTSRLVSGDEFSSKNISNLITL